MIVTKSNQCNATQQLSTLSIFSILQPFQTFNPLNFQPSTLQPFQPSTFSNFQPSTLQPFNFTHFPRDLSRRAPPRRPHHKRRLRTRAKMTDQ
jgi:hypothetical protein